METVNIEECKALIIDAIETKTPLLIEGSPGIGKTAIVGQCAIAVKRQLETLILSIRDQVDIGGFPTVVDGRIKMLAIGPLKRACEAPSVLFLDELTQTDSRMQGAAMRVVLDRVAGDDTLHPETAVIGAYNPVSQAAGGTELMPPMMNRFCVVKLVPDLAEIQAFFRAYSTLGQEFAATLEMMPQLVQLDPPAGSGVTMAQWASPRSWERALRVLAHQRSTGETEVMSSSVSIPQPDGTTQQKTHTKASTRMTAALVGNLGPDIGHTYLKILSLVHTLPSCKDICAGPMIAKLPPGETHHAAALMGVFTQVIKQDPWAAWIYAGRLQNEVRQAALRMTYQAPIRPDTLSQWATIGAKARITGMVEIAKMLAG